MNAKSDLINDKRGEFRRRKALKLERKLDQDWQEFCCKLREEWAAARAKADCLGKIINS